MKKQNLFYLISVTLLFVMIACDQTDTAKLEANKVIVRQFNEAVNNNNLDALDEIMTTNFVRHSQATPDVNIRSLEEFVIEGVKTTTPFHLKILQHKDFQQGNFDTKFIERLMNI